MEYNESLLDEGYDFKINLKHEEEVKGADSIVDENSRVRDLSAQRNISANRKAMVSFPFHPG